MGHLIRIHSQGQQITSLADAIVTLIVFAIIIYLVVRNLPKNK